jgi:hypothetical protein
LVRTESTANVLERLAKAELNSGLHFADLREWILHLYFDRDYEGTLLPPASD